MVNINFIIIDNIVSHVTPFIYEAMPTFHPPIEQVNVVIWLPSCLPIIILEWSPRREAWNLRLTLSDAHKVYELCNMTKNLDIVRLFLFLPAPPDAF